MNREDLRGVAKLLNDKYEVIFRDEDAMLAVLEHCVLRTLDKEEVLCEERQPGDEMYFLIAGTIEVRKRDLTGVVRRLTKLTAPSMFGHMSLVDDSPRSATCVAKGSALVAVLTRRSYQSLLRSPARSGAVMRHLLLSTMASQLARANDQILHMIDPMGPLAVDDDATSEEELFKTSSTLEGWRR
ncbi:MAG: cyclic nucleotide-binding domain-containing protein [Alphaproteobacteria bacterium]|nr:cyclic nucleotide-binding domain-containing protein [Alphaproteobacteria bacterium]